MLLKDIPGMLPTLANSPLARSALWERDVAELIPEQFVAQAWLGKDAGEPNMDDHIFHAVTQIHLASLIGKVPEDLPILKCKLRKPQALLSTELTEGLEKMPPAMARAAIFGLEMDMPLDALMVLSYMQAKHMDLTETARAALHNQTRSIGSPLAFWQVNSADRDNGHGPLRGFANEIYMNFGMSWNALRLAYKRLVPAHF